MRNLIGLSTDFCRLVLFTAFATANSNEVVQPYEEQL